MNRLNLLIGSACLLLISIFIPTIKMASTSYDFVFIVDITRSMNTQDYTDNNGGAISRLDKVKQDMISAIQTLPCGSRVGLGLFTERSSALLFSPIEVCSNYSILEDSIQHIDWRMAWVADSNIGRGLYNILKQLKKDFLLSSKLVFFTDGHESPPVNARYQADFADLTTEKLPASWRAGLIVGVGNKALSRIPKYDQDGHQTGFYQVDDVPHASSFGLPEDPSKIKGYIPRNGPWGTEKIVGTEHMSSLREEYLMNLAKAASLNYHRLTDKQLFSEALQTPAFTQSQQRDTSISWLPACLALLLLSYFYLIPIIGRITMLNKDN
ncbi:MAG: MxaL protein [Gammaproteobacteria bacterium]|nr:MAG: MxaL protein [Gammaproteobacteria bacterium]